MDDLAGPQAEALIAKLLAQPETARFECKRVSGKMVGKALETLCAFANTAGGTLALGLEDPRKAKGVDRLYGLTENPEAVDELRRKTLTHLLPAVDGLRWVRVACRLRDGRDGHLLLLGVPQTPKVHSILDDGTWTRMDASNREMSAAEITELSYRRGVISAESEPVTVPFELLETDTWRRFAANRGLLTGDLPDRLFRVGLAKRMGGELQPVRAAVLLFAEMRAANLFPPFYCEDRGAAQASVIVTLRNEERPPVREQVSDWIDRNGALVNSDLCQIAGVDTLRASKMLKRWVEQGVLLRDDSGGKRHTLYRKPMPDGDIGAEPSLSLPLDNGRTR